MKAEVWPVIHLIDRDKAMDCASIASRCGCMGVFLISMHGDDNQVDEIAPKVKMRFPLEVGVNYLTLEPAEAVLRSMNQGYQATWVDHCGIYNGLVGQSARDVAVIIRPRHRFFAGVAFKGKTYRDLNAGASAREAVKLGFIPTTTGVETGEAPDLGKIRAIRSELEPSDLLALASGAGPENAATFNAIGVTHFLVATGISKTFHEFDEGKLRAMMTALDPDIYLTEGGRRFCR